MGMHDTKISPFLFSHSFSLGLISVSMARNAAPSHHRFSVETQGKPGRINNHRGICLISLW